MESMACLNIFFTWNTTTKLVINFASTCAVLATIWYNYYNQERTEVIFFHGRQPYCDFHRNESNTVYSLNSKCPTCNIFKIVGWLNEAKKTLDICMYYFSHEVLANAVIDAYKRGVHVRFIGNNDDINSIWHFGTIGISLRVKPMQYKGKIMHHKFIIIDNKKIILGSMNWTRPAVRANWENLFLTNKRQIIDPFKQEFEIIWTQFSQ